MGVVLGWERRMTLGLAERQGDLLDDVKRFCDEALPDNSVYAVLHRERDRLFPDAMFADLFSDRGRRSVPPSVVATVMVLQRLEGLSDREAVERYTYDARWRYAAGVGGYDTGGWGGFAHTVLVDMRARLAASDDPRRIFNVTVEAASAAALVGAKRVLDSTPLYDAVATMDTITLIRSAIRGLLRVADEQLEAELRAVLASGDDYATTAKPQIDWDDADAREQLIDSRAKDAYACLALLDSRAVSAAVAEAAELLATVVGQDLEETDDGVFRIARRVAKDRVISTVDPEARHGHKTSARGFDGYKGHVAVDPDSEIITDTEVSPANVGDASVAADLIDDLTDDAAAEPAALADNDTISTSGGGGDVDLLDGLTDDIAAAEPAEGDAASGDGADQDAATDRDTTSGNAVTDDGADADAAADDEADRPAVYGDAAYGSGEFLDHLARNDIDARCKTQPPTAPAGLFTKDRFDIDLDDGTVTCPAGESTPIRRSANGYGMAYFAGACADCPLRPECTTAAGGRSVQVGPYEQRLADARRQQQDPDWVADYRATRPKVERKIGHLMRRRQGGRRARVRGSPKVDADFNLLAAAHNLARLAVLGVRFTPTTGWVAAT
jgi:hypothetical protein